MHLLILQRSSSHPHPPKKGFPHSFTHTSQFPPWPQCRTERLSSSHIGAPCPVGPSLLGNRSWRIFHTGATVRCVLGGKCAAFACRTTKAAGDTWVSLSAVSSLHAVVDRNERNTDESAQFKPRASCSTEALRLIFIISEAVRSGSACRLSIRSTPPLSRSCGRCVPACRSPALGPFSSWRPTPRPAAPTRRPPPRNEPLRAPAPPLGPAPQPGPPFRVAPPRGGPRPGSGCGRRSLAAEPWRMRITSRAARRSGATKQTEERWALRARGGPAAGMRRLGRRSLGAGRGARRGVERKGTAARWAGLVPPVLQRVSGERVVCRGAACEQKRPAYGNRGGAPEIAEVADVLCLQPARWWGWRGRRWCWSPAGVPEKVFNPWLHHGAVDI